MESYPIQSSYDYQDGMWVPLSVTWPSIQKSNPDLMNDSHLYKPSAGRFMLRFCLERCKSYARRGLSSWTKQIYRMLGGPNGEGGSLRDTNSLHPSCSQKALGTQMTDVRDHVQFTNCTAGASTYADNVDIPSMVRLVNISFKSHAHFRDEFDRSTLVTLPAFPGAAPSLNRGESDEK